MAKAVKKSGNTFFLSDRIIARMKLGGLAAVSVIVVLGLHTEYKRQRHIDDVMNGPIRANTETGNFYLPTCSGYNRIEGAYSVEFATMDDATLAGYSPGRGCSDRDLSIRYLNETEEPDFDHPSDPQYR